MATGASVPKSSTGGRETPFLPSGSGCCGGALAVFDEYGGGIWNGIEDHSVPFSIAWDPTALYIGMKAQ